MTGAPPPADRLAELLRKAASGLDRQATHDLLDAALDVAAAATDADGHDGRLGQAAALTLSSAVAGWTVPVQRSPEEWVQLADDDPEQWREDAAACMGVGYSVVPQPIISAIMFGLTALNGGTSPPAIMLPAPKEPGNGRNPRSRRELEQALLAYIEVEKAKGRRASDVQSEVADAVGRLTVDAIETWLKKWRKRDGKEHVASVLAGAAVFGRGQTVPAPVPIELILIRLVGLRGLAESWKAAHHG